MTSTKSQACRGYDSMTRSDLNALADRVEREELSPASDLDCLIHKAVGRPMSTYFGPGTNYTYSLDAAVTLTDWCIAHLSEIGGDGLPMCILTDGVREATGYCLNSPTSGVTALARALCAAALRARAALAEDPPSPEAKGRE